MAVCDVDVAVTSCSPAMAEKLKASYPYRLFWNTWL